MVSSNTEISQIIQKDLKKWGTETASQVSWGRLEDTHSTGLLSREVAVAEDSHIGTKLQCDTGKAAERS